MFDNKALKYSYAAQKTERHRLLRIVCIVFGIYILYNSLISLVCSIWVLENDTMQSGLAAGDRLAVVSFAVPTLLADIKLREQSVPFSRGDIVLVDTRLVEQRKLPHDILDRLVRFFTIQRVSIYKREDRLYIKRVIGLPGDEITMTNFVIRVKPAGSNYTFTEFELSDRPYYPVIPQVPALWDESLPFSGSMNRITLGADECFVVSDDRSNTNDSRTWGPVASKLVAGKAVFRVWPLTRIGLP